MRAAALAVLLLVFVSVAAADDPDVRYADDLERAFAPGGIVRLDLSAGEYRIRRGEERRIRVRWRTRTAAELDDVRVRTEVRGTEARVRTSGPRNHFHVEIELPGRSDLFLRMTAGDLSITGIEGNKDVRLLAGNLSIEVPDASAYGRVLASVTAGDLRAHPFGVTTGGLFRSFTRNGRGRFELRARLWAGDLRITPASHAEVR